MKKRKRYSVSELYEMDVSQIANRVIDSATHNMRVEGYSKGVSLEIALSDYSFWFNNDVEKEKQLIKIVDERWKLIE